jgi:hypothetical protein
MILKNLWPWASLYKDVAITTEINMLKLDRSMLVEELSRLDKDVEYWSALCLDLGKERDSLREECNALREQLRVSKPAAPKGKKPKGKNPKET